MTTTQIFHSLSENTDYQIENCGGTVCFVSWSRLKKHFATEVGLKENERILGIIVDADGITVKIDNKE